MNRKDFIKNSILGAAGISSVKALYSNNEKSSSTYDKLMEPVGFNHLPNIENKTMNSVLHKANTRGHANHGWLDSHHTFSFANYNNPERTNFGVLRVLNDDIVAGGRGFGKHPHDNMEIISIPMEGDLEHRDSMGNIGVIKEGDIQVMSAGTGIQHSEKNKNSQKDVKFLQIWLFPNKRNVQPRYDQLSLKSTLKPNQLNQVLSPIAEDEGVWIHQDAWFHIGEYTKPTTESYDLKKSGNGIYTFVLSGSVIVNDQKLDARDGFGVWNTNNIILKTTQGAKVLIMDVPMDV